jgi:hypothetical protein
MIKKLLLGVFLMLPMFAGYAQTETAGAETTDSNNITNNDNATVVWHSNDGTTIKLTDDSIFVVSTDGNIRVKADNLNPTTVLSVIKDAFGEIENDKATDEVADVESEFYKHRVFEDSVHESFRFAMLCVCFIIPCITIIILMLILVRFFIKKTRLRNSVIEKAIEANYVLPDAFYCAPQQVSQPTTDLSQPMDGDANRQQTAQSVNMQQPQRNLREHFTAIVRQNPSRLNRSVILMIIGLAIFLAFISEAPFLSYMVGGIMFLLGLFKLVCLYLVPTYEASNNAQRYNRYAQYTQQQQAPYMQQPQQPQQPQQHNVCPPPFPQQSSNDTTMITHSSL